MGKTKKKARLGRPPVAEPLKKRFFRCSDAEWELIEQAGADGNRSAFIRGSVVSAARRKLAKSAG